MHDDGSQLLQDCLVAGRKVTGLAVKDADRANPHTAGGNQRCTGIGTQVSRAGDIGIVPRPLVRQGVRDQQSLFRKDRKAADRVFYRRLARFKAGMGLEPLPVLVDEADDGCGCLENRARELRDPVEPGFIAAIEDLIAIQHLLPVNVLHSHLSLQADRRSINKTA
ncbi:hypothetical protein V6L77_00930 [Pannonibacter sp. Pt2-lr]